MAKKTELCELNCSHESLIFSHRKKKRLVVSIDIERIEEREKNVHTEKTMGCHTVTLFQLNSEEKIMQTSIHMEREYQSFEFVRPLLLSSFVREQK